ncbi:MAG: DegV family protein [Acutalibacteraceae bacterium]
MNKTAIMTDTNSGITPETAKENGIYLLKMPFAVNGKEYIEYGEMSYGEFFKVLDSGAEVSTSQPSPASLTEMWDDILKDYESVVYFPMSSGLSGTCETARALATEYDGRVLVVDNKRISVTLYSSVFNAVKQAEDGLSAEEIADFAEKEASEQSIYVSVNTLEHLKKSGRVTAAGAAIGTLLGIKPVLQIQGGKLDAYKKVRGMKAAVEAMLDGIENDLNTRFAGKKIEIRAAYSGDIEVGKEWQAQVKERFPDLEIELNALPLSISCHVGGGALGIGISVVL